MNYAYNAQQAAEKAIKAVFIHLHEPFPYTHDIDRLLDLLESKGVEFPDFVRSAAKLTDFAFQSRYPNLEEVSQAKYEQALATASLTVDWAAGIIGMKEPDQA